MKISVFLPMHGYQDLKSSDKTVNAGITGHTGLKIRVCIGKLFSLFPIQNICCGYSKEPSQSDGSFEHPKHMFKFVGKKIFTVLRLLFFFFTGPMITAVLWHQEKVSLESTIS